MDWIGQLTAMG